MACALCRRVELRLGRHRLLALLAVTLLLATHALLAGEARARLFPAAPPQTPMVASRPIPSWRRPTPSQHASLPFDQVWAHAAAAAAAAAPCNRTRSRVISYGLYGDSTRYTTNALRNMALAAVHFPGWVVRFYMDDTVPSAVRQALIDAGAEVLSSGERSLGNRGTAGMFWRFRVAADPCVDAYIIRDADSHLSAREAAAVAQWLATAPDEYGFHVIRDHPSHTRIEVSGGMWGGRVLIPHIESLMQRVEQGAYHSDMDFLKAYLWPVMDHFGVFQHDDFACEFYGGRGLPTPRVGLEHIGAVFDERGNMREGDTKILRGALPGARACVFSDKYHVRSAA